MLDILPDDTLCVIASFSDFFTRIRLRHVNQHLFYLSELVQSSKGDNCHDNQYVIPTTAISFFNILVEEEDLIMILDQPQLYIQFFQEMSSTDTQHSFHKCMLPVILNGCMVMMDRYGVNKAKFIVNLFLETIFIQAIEFYSHSSTNTTTTTTTTTTLDFLLRELKNRVSLWNSIDRIVPLYSRRIIFDSIVKLSEKGMVTEMIIQRLLVDCKLNIDEMTFQKERHLLEDSPNVHLIPKTCSSFSLIHLATWLNDRTLVTALIENGVKYGLTLAQVVDKQDKLYRTPLIYCVMDEKLNSMAEWLMRQYSANPFEPDIQQWTAFDMARLYKRDHLISVIRELYRDQVLNSNSTLPTKYPYEIHDLEEMEREDIATLESYYQSGRSILYEPDDEETIEKSDQQQQEEQEEESVLNKPRTFFSLYGWDRYDDYDDEADGDDNYDNDDPCFKYDESCGIGEDVESRDEQGIHTDFIMKNNDPNSEVVILDKYVKPFEELFDYYHDSWSEDYDSESGMKSQGVHVKSIRPFELDVEDTQRNENGKRERSEDDHHHSNKRMKVDTTTTNEIIIERSSLIFPKHVFRLLVKPILSQYTRYINRFTPLSILTIQHAAEKWLEKQFEIANDFSEFYGSGNTIKVDDMYAAQRYMRNYCTISDPSTMHLNNSDDDEEEQEDLDEEEEEDDYESDVSSDSCQ